MLIVFLLGVFVGALIVMVAWSYQAGGWHRVGQVLGWIDYDDEAEYQRRLDEQGCTAACSEGHTYTWPCEQAIYDPSPNAARPSVDGGEATTP